MAAAPVPTQPLPAAKLDPRMPTPVITSEADSAQSGEFVVEDGITVAQSGPIELDAPSTEAPKFAAPQAAEDSGKLDTEENAPTVRADLKGRP